jgi:hypothetical protein
MFISGFCHSKLCSKIRITDIVKESNSPTAQSPILYKILIALKSNTCYFDLLPLKSLVLYLSR